MKLSQIFSKEDIIKLKGSIDTEITAFVCDSRKATAGCAFFALPGTKDDGLSFAADATARGAVAVVSEKEADVPENITNAVVKNIRALFARAVFFENGNPQKKLKIIGVTGTNGKTTIATLIHKMLIDAGKKSALFTTVSYDICGELLPSTHTTPPPEILAPLFKKASERGAEYAVMEVSSHSLSQGRVDALDFNIGIFTNISRDHLDYHGTIEEYTRVKATLFDKCERAIINTDDERGALIAKNAKCRVYTLSCEKDADFKITSAKTDISGISYTLTFGGESADLASPVTGGFNICNTAECAAAALLSGIPQKSLAKTLSSFRGAAGRLEKIIPERLPFSVIIDYAHTPDALEKTLRTVRAVTAGRVFCVFGCGGERDRGKRGIMGNIALSLSDTAVITSDNPRSERPEDIIADIVRALPEDKTNFVTITEREAAIAYAMENARAGDTVLLAGKGHEDYIIDAGGKRYFSEKEIVEKTAERMGF